MPKYKFQCSNHECVNVFDIVISPENYCAEQECPVCKEKSNRVFTPISVHQGMTLSQKNSGTSSKTIEHSKHMRDAREKRKKNYAPDSREAQSNELWLGNEIQDGVIQAPKK